MLFVLIPNGNKNPDLIAILDFAKLQSTVADYCCDAPSKTVRGCLRTLRNECNAKFYNRYK